MNLGASVKFHSHVQTDGENRQMALHPRNSRLKSSLPSLLLMGPALLFTALASPGSSRTALCPSGAPELTSGSDGPEISRTCVTLVVDGMMKSRSGAT